LLLSGGACCTAPEAGDRYLLPAGRAAANPPATVAAVDRCDRQTDGQTLNRYIDLAPHTMRAASIILPVPVYRLQFFDAVGWAAGRASGL